MHASAPWNVFIGILTEHYAGAFPTWMAPVQVKVLPISEKHVEYANQLAKQMRHDYVRVEVDDRNEKNWLQNSPSTNGKSSLHARCWR